MLVSSAVPKLLYMAGLLPLSMSKSKPSGGLLKKARDKRLFELHGKPTHTGLGKRKAKYDRIKGGELKVRLLKVEIANVYDPKAKAYRQAKIKRVVEGANPHFVRSNIITRGAVIETELGKARVTNRPGQEAAVNAVLVEEVQKS